jgi:acyl-CoA synthetase (AMP-forming)/AMP-acid ligase II
VVVGVADPRWGERVTALLKVRDGVTVTPDEVIAHCRTKVAGYKVPRDVWFVESMERHPSGKPDYRWAKTTAAALAAG